MCEEEDGVEHSSEGGASNDAQVNVLIQGIIS